jgi:hypothetical protein
MISIIHPTKKEENIGVNDQPCGIIIISFRDINLDRCSVCML